MDRPRVICLVQMRMKYGRSLTYPVNSVAKLLAALTMHTTLSTGALQLIDQLGFEIEYVPPSIDPDSINSGE